MASRSHRAAVAVLGCVLSAASLAARAQSVAPGDEPAAPPWLDRAHQWLFDSVWRSARSIDGWFGPQAPESEYQRVVGSIAPALLWDQYDGLQPRLRFNVDLPLPRLNQRYHAFIGRVNPDEYVTERELPSGAFPSQRNRLEDDQTVFGIRYRPAGKDAHFSADAGVRLQFPLDPFVKGSYEFQHGEASRALLLFRETVFWQNSERLGLTSRIDVERVIDLQWLVRGTLSGTISQQSDGVRGYTALTVIRGMPKRRALAAQLFTSGEMDAEVPLEDYGIKLAYRRSVARDWLVMELRTSLTWPKEKPAENRNTNLGVGIGFEIFFGTDEFLARPVTF